MNSLNVFCKDIKITHSVFALPFAAATLFLTPILNVSWQHILLLIGCLVTARSYAMGMNRVLDHRLDALNARTANRMIPRGAISWQKSLVYSLVCASLFVLLTLGLTPTATICSIPVLIILGLYPLTKRFTSLCHLYLGLCLGLTPPAVLIALGQPPSPASIVLGISIALWVAGFDTIYALADRNFDRIHRLHSIPARFNTSTALTISRACFAITIIGLITVGYLTNSSLWYWIGTILCATILTTEHILLKHYISHNSLTTPRLNQIFFYANATLSLCYLLFVVLDKFA